MNDYQRAYYHEMKKRNRLIPIMGEDNQVVALITFYIGNGNPSKYVREDSWSVVNDEPTGNVCYIDHLITDGEKDNPRKSYAVWHHVKDYIKQSFPLVEKIRWNRFKGGKVNVHIKDIK